MSPLIQVGAPTVILATAILVTFASVLRPMVLGRPIPQPELLNARIAPDAAPIAASTVRTQDVMPVQRFNPPVAASLTMARPLPVGPLIAGPPQAPPARDTEIAEQMRLRALTDYAANIVHSSEVRRAETPQPTATRVILLGVRTPVNSSSLSAAPPDAASNGYVPTAAESRAARLL